MATIVGRSTVQLDVTMRLSEPEARALYDLTSYGTDEFLSAFREKLGQHYIDKHEAGLRSLFDCVRDKLHFDFAKADAARQVFHAPIPPVDERDCGSGDPVE